MAEDLPPPEVDEEDTTARPSATMDEVASERPDPALATEMTWDPFDDYEEGFQPSIFRVMEADGMPSGPIGGGPSDIPPLSPETLVCMEIATEFVIRDVQSGEIFLRFPKDMVERAPNGQYRLPWAKAAQEAEKNLSRALRQAAERVRARRGLGADRSDAEILLLLAHGRTDWSKPSPAWILVEPLRRRCSHYVRQLSQFSLNPENQKVYRTCSARRDTAGAWMTLDDTAMWACDIRQPRDLDSESKLEEFDQKKMKEGRERMYLPLIGPAPERKADG